MELIRQIKDAEKQAGDVIEKAGQDAALLSEQVQKERGEQLKTAQQCRIKAVDEAVSQAAQDGTAQVRQITETGSEAVSSLKAAYSSKANACVEKVLSQLQQV